MVALIFLPRRHLHVALLASFIALLLILAVSPPGRRAPPARLSHRPPQPRLHVLLPIDAPNPLFCQSLLTVFLSGIAPVLVNFNTSAALAVKGDRFENMALKIKGVLDYLQNNVTSGADVVLMADAMDVWWQLPEAEIMDRYLAMDSPLVFSAEKNCFAGGPLCDTFPQSSLPEDVYGPLTDTGDLWYNRPRWLNSGLIIGRASHFLPVFTYARKLQQEEGVSNDQAVMHMAYATGGFGITLDFRSELFQNMYYADDDIVWKDARHTEGSALESDKKKAWTLAPSLHPSLVPLNNRRFFLSNSPAALHFNGGGNAKEHARPLWDEEWWVRLGSTGGKEADDAKKAVRKVLKEGRARVAHDGREVGWGELCEGHVRGMWAMEWLAEGGESA